MSIDDDEYRRWYESSNDHTIDGEEFVPEDMTVNIINLQNEKHALLNGSVYRQYERDILYALSNLSE